MLRKDGGVEVVKTGRYVGWRRGADNGDVQIAGADRQKLTNRRHLGR